jgi:hypothetical protein
MIVYIGNNSQKESQLINRTSRVSLITMLYILEIPDLIFVLDA